MALALPQQVVRRSGRIPKEIPIVRIGSDLAGKIFSEQTKTVLLSLHGASLLSRHKLSPEQEMVLRWPERKKEADVRMVGPIGDSGVYTYGVAFSDQVENFWEMEFPPPSPREHELGVLTLVCNVCQTLERLDDQSIEAGVVATNDGVLRFCKRCGNSTIWKVGKPGAQPAVPVSAGAPVAAPPQTPMLAPMAPPQRVASPPAAFSEFGPASPAPRAGSNQPGTSGAGTYSALPPSDLIIGGIPTPAAPASVTSSYRPTQPESARPSQPSPATSVLTLPGAGEKPAQKPIENSTAPRVNRRKYPRIKVNYIALVRHAKRGEEFVQCEDVSRGGLRFKSTSKYMEQTLIEVAAPYSSRQPTIFVPARIVYVQELPEQNLFRYGVEYLNITKPRGTF